jgi:hypothetical protein
MIACTLINLKTGQRIKARSVVDFCRQAKLEDKDAVVHIYPILRGERLQHLGWCLPEYWNKWIELEDCYGHVYQGYIRDLLYGYKLSACTIWNLLRGKKKIISGIALKGTRDKPYVPLKPYKIKKYVFDTPNGSVVQGHSIQAVANQLKGAMTMRSLWDILHGMRESRKGYNLRDVETEERQLLQPKT